MAGKSIDDLHLSDVPIVREPMVDPRQTEWYRFVQDIEDLLASGRVTFAEDTLRGIQQSVELTKRVTEGQQRAVRNIEAGAQRARRSGGFRSRRYEGYR